MKPSSILLVAVAVGGVLGGLLMWETVGPSPLCGGCYRYNAPGCLVTPCPGLESLTIETSQVNSPTNLTLSVRNVGSVGISFDSYIVKDSAGNQYAKINWTTTLFMNSNQLAIINMIIDGNAFTFQSKNIYTVTLITTRNNQFTFPITA
jgi:archaellum component FlaG (FlaF/FlaG flagellin family)